MDFDETLCKWKTLGLIFKDFVELLIFIYFSMFYTYLNMTQIRIFEKYRNIFRKWGFQKIGNTTIMEKSIHLDFFLKHFDYYWALAQSKYTKLKLKYHSFQENQKNNYTLFFRTWKLKKCIFQGFHNFNGKSWSSAKMQNDWFQRIISS